MNRIILTLLMVPIVAVAEPQLYMKKDNPNQIHISSAVRAECPITGAELLKEIGGVFVRARIKPLSSLDALPALFITLDCQELLPNKDIFVWLFFADFVGGAELADGSRYPARYDTEIRYSFFGRGDWESARGEIRRVSDNLGEGE